MKINKTLISLFMLTLSWISCGASGENIPAATLPPSVKQDRPTSFANDNEMLDYIQKVHLNYMWDGAESNSGLAPERIHLDGIYPQNDKDVVTTGGSGFGIAGLLVGIDRGFIDAEEKQVAASIDKLWKEMEFDWYRRGGQDVLYWHWSPNYGWEMNFPLEGYNECLITYILGAASPTHSISADCYHKGWARSGGIKSTAKPFGYALELKHNGAEQMGGPLFWAQYSYIGLDPRNLSDQYANYWNVVQNHALSDYEYCVRNPKGYKGYGKKCWGLTASYSVDGYSAHAPNNDLGVITPTAALSSFPYTPEQSMNALKYFYAKGAWIWGKYGFYDAFSETKKWTVPRYLAIDQLTIAPMIENYRSGLLWKLFMSCPEVQEGLTKLGFIYK